jgi:E-phenylitaconyl-CoA hydratase
VSRLEDLEQTTLRLERHDRVLLVVMVAELRALWQHYDADDSLGCVVLTGAGDRGFSTGLDVDDTLAAGVRSPSLDDEGRVVITARDLGIHKPVVVAVNGSCCAGGWHFVDDADVVLASSTATFFDTHVDVGLSNPVEAVGLLSKLPAGEVLRMVLSGRAYRLDADRAHALGLVTEVTDPGRLTVRALEVAADIAQHPVDLLRTSAETLWTAILEARASAEAHGLAALAAADASFETRAASMAEFRHP